MSFFQGQETPRQSALAQQQQQPAALAQQQAALAQQQQQQAAGEGTGEGAGAGVAAEPAYPEAAKTRDGHPYGGIGDEVYCAFGPNSKELTVDLANEVQKKYFLDFITLRHASESKRYNSEIDTEGKEIAYTLTLTYDPYVIHCLSDTGNVSYLSKDKDTLEYVSTENDMSSVGIRQSLFGSRYVPRVKPVLSGGKTYSKRKNKSGRRRRRDTGRTRRNRKNRKTRKSNRKKTRRYRKRNIKNRK